LPAPGRRPAVPAARPLGQRYQIWPAVHRRNVGRDPASYGPGHRKYLGGGLVKGIGPRFAKRIVAQFQEDTLLVIEDNPDRLIEVEGIGRKRVEIIKKAWREQKEIKNVMLFLQEHGVSAVLATKIYKQYGNDSIAIVKENPYRLADDIWGIGFYPSTPENRGKGVQRAQALACAEKHLG